MIARAIKALLKRFDRRLQCESTFQLLDRNRHALLALYQNAANADPRSIPGASQIEGIVFSKDRPLQLHALLKSYLHHVESPAPLHVLYKATSPEMECAYRELFTDVSASPIAAHAESNFRDDVRQLLGTIRSERVFFLVDDILFIEPFDLDALCRWDWLRYIPTLRHGRGIDYCYTRSVPQKEPPFLTDAPPGFIIWRWQDGEHEYAFPLSLDGHVFHREEIAIIAAHSDFVGPNTLETILQLYIDAFLCRQAVAYEKARLVNVPWNRVQAEWDSRHGTVSEAELLRAWQDGMEVDIHSFSGYKNRSTHEELPLKLIPRKAAISA